MTPASRPVVGVTAYIEPVDRGDWVDSRSTVLPQDYVDMIEQAGGVALVIPPREDFTDEMAAQLIDRLDALVIAGGADVEASRYGAQRHPSMQDPRPDRDATEIALVRAARAAGLPLLGVCRGMQVMAVEAGGALIQHVPDVVGHPSHSPSPGVYGDHDIRTVAGSRVAAAHGREISPTKSYHHQAVASHPGYEATAWSVDDGLLEAMEQPGEAFCVGVQWHPEVGRDDRLFRALVDAARTRSTSAGAGSAS